MNVTWWEEPGRRVGDLALAVSSAINLLCHSSPFLRASVSSRIKCGIELCAREGPVLLYFYMVF